MEIRNKNGKTGAQSKPRLRLQEAPVADAKDQADDKIARWGRSRTEGYKKFKHGFLQPPPLLFTQDHHPLWLGDIYRGRTAFLIAGGPSFNLLDHSLLRKPGILTMGLNNSVKTFRPHLWTCVDPPHHFIRSIWLDPVIMKFVPICHARKFVFNNDAWAYTEQRVGDCPNVVYFKRNEHLKPSQYLWEDCINWGNHKDHGGGRSVMLAAIRILFILGIRRLFLLGVDFQMDSASKYHFDQQRSASSIGGNNATYKKLNQWFAELRPYFEQVDFHVFNCNKESRLTAFDHIPYEIAISMALEEFGLINVAEERTRGLYDTKEKEKINGIGK